MLALCSDDGSCALLDFLEDPDLDRRESTKMLARIDHMARAGPSKNKEQFNTLGDDIFELKTRMLRVFFFYDEGRVIVCSHGHKKEGQKLDPRQKERALRVRTQYFADKASRNVEVIDP